MTSPAGTHALGVVRIFVASVAKVQATRFPPPLRGRDREGGGGRCRVSIDRPKSESCFQLTPECDTKFRACCYPPPCPSPARGEGTRGEGTLWRGPSQQQR